MKKQSFLAGPVDRNDPVLQQIIQQVRASNQIDFYGKQGLVSMLKQLSPSEVLELKNLTSGLVPGGIVFIVAKYLMGKGLGTSILMGILGTLGGAAVSSMSRGPRNSHGQQFLDTHNNFGKKYFIG